MIARAGQYAAAFMFFGALGAVAWAQAAPPARTPIQRVQTKATTSPTPKQGVSCQGGPEGLADIELIPDAVISQGGRERIEYHAEIVAKRGQRLGIAWNADVISDRGQVVASGLDTGQATKRSGDAVVTRREVGGAHIR